MLSRKMFVSLFFTNTISVLRLIISSIKKICKKQEAYLNCVLSCVHVTTCRTGTEKMLPEICICVWSYCVLCLSEDSLLSPCCVAL